MRRERIAPIGIICLAVSLAACATKKDAKVDSAGVVAEGPAAGMSTPPRGTLPGGWESKNSEEFRAYVDSVEWTEPVSGERTCADTKKCKKVAATISANSDARNITALNAGSGALMARMELKGPYETAMYKLKPGSHKYYVVVIPSAGGGDMSWKMVEVADKKNTAISVVGDGTFHNCKHNPNPGAPAKADWKGCDEGSRPASQSSDSGGSSGGDQPGWVSCAEGCCTVSAVQLAVTNVEGLLATTASSRGRNRGPAKN